MPSLSNRRRAGRVAGALVGLLREPAIGTTVEWSTDTGKSFTGHSLPESSVDPGLARWSFIVALPSPDFTVTTEPPPEPVEASPAPAATPVRGTPRLTG